MGRRLRHPSEFEQWREQYRRELSDRYGDEAFVALVLAELDDEVACFGPDDRPALMVFAEGRALVRRRMA